MGCSPRLAVRLGAVVVAAAAGVTLLPAAAHAGGPGVWTTLSQNPAAGGHPRMSLLDEPTVARFGDELQVAWRDDAADGSQSLRARAVGADGRALTAPVTVVAGWRGLLENPRLIDVGGRRTLVFSGRRGTGDPFSTGATYTASSPDGRGWGLVPGALSTSDVYAGYGFDAVDVGGVPLWVGNTGTTGVRWHRGPAGASAEGVLPLADCCGSDAAVARDAVTGEVWTAFFATSDRSDVAGIHVARLLPTVAAGPRAPGSVTSYLGGLVARTPDQRVAMAARSGGGVWIAYAQGYPTVTGIRLYDVRSRRSLVVPGSAGARDISLAAAPGGRLWVTWVDAAARSLRAVRSNAAVTRFGEVRVIPAPAGQTTVWKTAGEGSRGRLDLVATAQRSGSGQINVFHQQVLPALTVAFGRTLRVNRAGVRFYAVTVADAGTRLAGVTVRIGRRAVGVTNATGAVFVPVGRGVRGRFVITASRPGYQAGQRTLVVR